MNPKCATVKIPWQWSLPFGRDAVSSRTGEHNCSGTPLRRTLVFGSLEVCALSVQDQDGLGTCYANALSRP